MHNFTAFRSSNFPLFLSTSGSFDNVTGSGVAIHFVSKVHLCVWDDGTSIGGGQSSARQDIEVSLLVRFGFNRSLRFIGFSASPSGSVS